MSDSRTKNATRNIVYGVIGRIVSLILPFTTRTIVLYLLGTSYLGIGTLFSSILGFLNLAELGLGSAIAYSMYKPVAENNTEMVCAILLYFRRLHRVIGMVILLVGLLMMPFLDNFIKGETPTNINIYILYSIYLLNSVLSYLWAGYKQSLFASHQRLDISSKVFMIVNVFIHFTQILVLLLSKNFYIFAFVPIAGTLISNITIAVLTKKMYPELYCTGELSNGMKQGIRKNISGLIGTKLNSIVVHSADSIVISAFLGLKLTAQYGNYYFIINSLTGFIVVLFSSLTSSVGNKIALDSMDNNYQLFRKLSFINAWIVGWCSICLVCLYQPFMEMWVGRELMFDFGFAILMALYFYMYQIQKTILIYKDAAGLWYVDRFRPYFSMIINIVGNILLVQMIGIYGVALSSIIAFLISIPWINHVLFKNLFMLQSWKNLLDTLKYFAITATTTAVTYAICLISVEGPLGLMQRMLICILVPNLVFWLCFRNSEEFRYSALLITRVFRRNRESK